MDKLLTCIKIFRSAPASPSHSGVSGLVTPDSLSREPSPVPSDNPADSASDSNTQTTPAVITQPAYIALTHDIQVSHTTPGSPGNFSFLIDFS